MIRGDRVKHADADRETNIPAYRNMRGTVVGFRYGCVLVQWDCDSPNLGPSRYPSAQLTVVEEVK
jgi:hypothetical protein